MTTTATQAIPTQVYRIYIRATAQAIWDAITRPEWTVRYGYNINAEYDLRPGGKYRARPSAISRARGELHGVPSPDVIAEGDILEVNAPYRLVTTFRFTIPAEAAAEPTTRLTYEIEPKPDGTCMLTVTHDLDGAPIMAAIVSGQGGAAGGGHAWILSDLKTLLETQKAFAE